MSENELQQVEGDIHAEEMTLEQKVHAIIEKIEAKLKTLFSDNHPVLPEISNAVATAKLEVSDVIAPTAASTDQPNPNSPHTEE